MHFCREGLAEGIPRCRGTVSFVPLTYSFGQECRVLCAALCCVLRGHEIDPCPQEACGSELFSVDAALASERNTLHFSVPRHPSGLCVTPGHAQLI